MRTTSITNKAKLDILGENNRKRFLADYAKELNNVPCATSVKESCSSFFHQVLGSSAYIFVSINLTTSNIRRSLAKEKITNGGTIPPHFIPYGQQYLESIESGISSQEAEETLWNKFMIRVNQKVLGAKFKRYGHHLRWVRVHENFTKHYSKAPTNHIHMLLEVPASQISLGFNELKLKQIFRELFSSLVCPIPSTSRNSAVLNIIQGRLTGTNAHPSYILKQVKNWDVACDRVFVSAMQKSRVSEDSAAINNYHQKAYVC
jgi:hypothetical protein